MNQRGIGVSNLPNIKYRSICRKGLAFNIMVIGSHGLGKTSFINGLFDMNLLVQKPFEEGDGELVEIRGYEKNGSFLHPTFNFQISNFVVQENEFKTRITITEVDAYGDSFSNEDCWIPVLKYIKDNYQDYMEQESKNVRRLITDRRIHVCLYFLEPFIDFIRPVDLNGMVEISKYCNLIPIVAKNDMLSEVKKQKCFDFLRNVFESNNIAIFEEKISIRGDIKNMTPPFFITSPVISKEGISYERKYPWGTLNIAKQISNDLFRVRDMVINKNLLSLIESTEEFYDIYRAAALSYFINKKTVSSINPETLKSELTNRMKDEIETIKKLKERISLKKREYESRINKKATLE